MVGGHVHGEGDHEQQAVAEVNLKSVISNSKIPNERMIPGYSTEYPHLVLCSLYSDLAAFGWVWIPAHKIMKLKRTQVFKLTL